MDLPAALLDEEQGQISVRLRLQAGVPLLHIECRYLNPFASAHFMILSG